MSSLVCCLIATACHAAPRDVGRTQASSVTADERLSELELGTCTRELVPLKLSAPPNLPVVHEPEMTVPMLPLPDASAATVPEAVVEAVRGDEPRGGRARCRREHGEQDGEHGEEHRGGGRAALRGETEKTPYGCRA